MTADGIDIDGEGVSASGGEKSVASSGAMGDFPRPVWEAPADVFAGPIDMMLPPKPLLLATPLKAAMSAVMKFPTLLLTMSAAGKLPDPIRDEEAEGFGESLPARLLACHEDRDTIPVLFADLWTMLSSAFAEVARMRVRMLPLDKLFRRRERRMPAAGCWLLSQLLRLDTVGPIDLSDGWVTLPPTETAVSSDGVVDSASALPTVTPVNLKVPLLVMSVKMTIMRVERPAPAARAIRMEDSEAVNVSSRIPTLSLWKTHTPRCITQPGRHSSQAIPRCPAKQPHCPDAV
mmetsp:Transcript_18149/g.50797  ORF Transcript_18149/g.50797 Transcript_18149/m.50797 type:complete len:290 (+) Transcript_18149:266-1135(+)